MNFNDDIFFFLDPETYSKATTMLSIFENKRENWENIPNNYNGKN